MAAETNDISKDVIDESDFHMAYHRMKVRAVEAETKLEWAMEENDHLKQVLQSTKSILKTVIQSIG